SDRLYKLTSLQLKNVTKQLQFASWGLPVLEFSSKYVSSLENFRPADRHRQPPRIILSILLNAVIEKPDEQRHPVCNKNKARAMTYQSQIREPGQTKDYQGNTAEAKQLIQGKNGTWNGINPESVARMRLQNRFRTGLDIAKYTAAIMR